MWELMEDLQDMGESNAVIGRSGLPMMIQHSVTHSPAAEDTSVEIHLQQLRPYTKVRFLRFIKTTNSNQATIEMHGSEDGTIPATFQVIYMVCLVSLRREHVVLTFVTSQIGWKPSPSQPKPLDRGTGKVNLKEVL